MKTRFLIIMSIIVGMTVSLPFMLEYSRTLNQEDVKIMEKRNV